MQIEDQSNIIIQDKNEFGDVILRNLRPILNHPECFRCHTAGQRINGVLEVDVSLAEMQQHVGRLRKTMIIWAVAITALLALALSTLLSKLVTNPIRDLTNTMAKAEEGLDVRAKVISEDELGRLAHSFNSMLIKLNKTKKKVEKLHYEQMKRADRLATVGEMAAGIAHEIKNPLTGIAGVIQILGRGIPPEDDRHKIIKEVLEQIDRLDKAVKNLLSFARPPAPNLTEVRINALLEKIIAFLSPQFSKNQVTVRKDYSAGSLGSFGRPGTPPAGFSEYNPERRPGHAGRGRVTGGDEHQFDRRPDNAQSRPRGRRRTFYGIGCPYRRHNDQDNRFRERDPAGEHGEDIQPLLHYEAAGDWPWPGHNPEDNRTAWRRDYRRLGTREVDRLYDLSAAGKGQDDGADSLTQEGSGMEKAKILVVDDEHLIRWTLEQHLGHEGYEVYTAEDGEKALQMVADLMPNLVLLDNQLPGIQGIEVLGRIKEIDKETIVIMITAHGLLGDRREGDETGRVRLYQQAV